MKVLIIDDCMYSGDRVMYEIDSMAHNLSGTGVMEKVTFYVVAPFVSRYSVDNINELCNLVEVKCSIIYSELLDSMDFLIDLSKYYSNPERDLYDKFGIERIKVPPAFFDHKVAGDMSTFSTIYLDGRIPGNASYGTILNKVPDRSYMTVVKDMLERSEMAFD